MGEGGGGGGVWIINIGHHKYAIYVGLSLELLRTEVIVECIDQYHSNTKKLWRMTTTNTKNFT